MGRRKHYMDDQCKHDGCTKRSLNLFDRSDDYNAERKRRNKHPWACLRHTQPDETMGTDNRLRVFEAVAQRSVRYPELDELFWGDGSGFVPGPGFRAWARDFPPGTRLRVTAEILLPDETVFEATEQEEP